MMMAESLATDRHDDPLAELLRGGAPRDAIARAAREYGKAVGKLCMALLGVQAEAEEAAQETFIAAFDGASSYRGDGSAKAWLFGIARRICARRTATRVRRENRLRLVHDAGAEGQTPDEALDRRRSAERVRAALEDLRPSEREALLLRYATGLSYREIGEACGIDEAAARKRASRGLGHLRAVLSREGDA
jgi:RNA polymerase sigma-70 factor (ECF subfamily)